MSVVPMRRTVFSFSQLADSFQSFLSGLGTFGRDKGVTAVPTLRILSPKDLSDLFRGDWLSYKIVTTPAFDATRAWRSWQAEQEEIEALEDAERAFGYQRKVMSAIMRARLYGGSAMIIGVQEGSGPSKQDSAWAERAVAESRLMLKDAGHTTDVIDKVTKNASFLPALDLDKVGEGDLKFIHVVERWMIAAGPRVRDITSPWFGEPNYYMRSNIPIIPAPGGVEPVESYSLGYDPGATIFMHPSRVVKFIGHDYPDIEMAPDAWGDSVLQTVYEAIKDAGLVSQSIANLTTRANTNMIKVPGLTENLATEEGSQRVTRRFAAVNAAQSVVNAVLIDKDEDWAQLSVSFGGLPQVLQMYLMIASGAADIPATRLLGREPAGQNATGESDLRNYYDRLSAEQEVLYRPLLSPLDEVLIRSTLGKRDREINYTWNPLWLVPEEVKSAMDYQKSQSYQIDVNTGLIEPQALKEARINQLIQDDVYPGLEDALEKVQEEMYNEWTPEDEPMNLQTEEGGGQPNEGNEGPPKKKPFGDAWTEEAREASAEVRRAKIAFAKGERHVIHGEKAHVAITPTGHQFAVSFHDPETGHPIRSGGLANTVEQAVKAAHIYLAQDGFTDDLAGSGGGAGQSALGFMVSGGGKRKRRRAKRPFRVVERKNSNPDVNYAPGPNYYAAPPREGAFHKGELEEGTELEVGDEKDPQGHGSDPRGGEQKKWFTKLGRHAMSHIGASRHKMGLKAIGGAMGYSNMQGTAAAFGDAKDPLGHGSEARGGLHSPERITASLGQAERSHEAHLAKVQSAIEALPEGHVVEYKKNTFTHTNVGGEKFWISNKGKGYTARALYEQIGSKTLIPHIGHEALGLFGDAALTAAGVLFVDPDGYGLFLKRVDSGEWSVPAGNVEDDEDLDHAARREAAEETNYPGDFTSVPVDRRTTGNVDFVTFLQQTPQFEPVLNHEHDEWRWARLDQPPEPLHPGLAETLAELEKQYSVEDAKRSQGRQATHKGSKSGRKKTK